MPYSATGAPTDSSIMIQPSPPSTPKPSLSTKISNKTSPILGVSITLLCIQSIALLFYQEWLYPRGEIQMVVIIEVLQWCIYLIYVILATIICNYHKKNPNVLVPKRFSRSIVGLSIVSFIILIFIQIFYFLIFRRYENLSDSQEIFFWIYYLVFFGLSLGMLIQSIQLVNITYPNTPIINMTSSPTSY